MSAIIRRLAAPVAVALLSLLVGAPTTGATTFPGQNGKVAWSTTRHDPGGHSCVTSCNWEIYTMNPDGTSPQRLTSNTVADTQPVWSSDGTKLAFNRWTRQQPMPNFNAMDLYDVYIVDPDGSDAIRVATDIYGASPVSWSPDGTRLAFSRPFIEGSSINLEVFAAAADGTGEIRLTNEPRADWKPVWSPDSQKIAWVSNRDPYTQGGVWVANADGTGGATYTPIIDSYSMDGETVEFVAWAPGPRPIITTHIGGHANSDFPGTDTSWAPDTSRLGFIEGFFASDGRGLLDIATMNPDGTDVHYVTSDPERFDRHLEWAPNSARFVYARTPTTQYEFANTDIYVVNTDGSGLTNLTNAVGEDQDPSWQPVSFQPTFPGAYARPKGASPFKVSLVPAYDACTSPNATHGSPLDSAACVPPVPASTSVTVGTTDANGAEANSQASIRLTVQRGDPGPPEDSDVRIQASVTDVRCLSGTSTCGNANTVGGEDYIGELQGNVNVRVTDRFSESTGGERVAATVVDLPFPFKFQCADTPSIDEGAVCAIVTSYDAIAPGIAREGQRAIWDLTQANVTDGGPDGMTETVPNTFFLRQGIFVP